jgi:hypothetical protein
MLDTIINNIDNIYENININKAIFITKYNLINDLQKELSNKLYPVCTMNDNDKFINHTSRILIINSIDLEKLKTNRSLKYELYNVNLIIFIETPIIPSKFFFKDYFNLDTLSNDKHIYQI